MPRGSGNLYHELNISETSLLRMKIKIKEDADEASPLAKPAVMEPKENEGELVKQSKSTMRKSLEEHSQRKHSASTAAAPPEHKNSGDAQPGENIASLLRMKHQLRKLVADLPVGGVQESLVKILADTELTKDEIEKAVKESQDKMRKVQESESRRQALIKGGYDSLALRGRDLGASYPRKSVVVMPRVDDDGDEQAITTLLPNPEDQLQDAVGTTTGPDVLSSSATSFEPSQGRTTPEKTTGSGNCIPFTFQFYSDTLQASDDEDCPDSRQSFRARSKVFGKPPAFNGSIEEGEVMMKKGLETNGK